MTSPDEGAITAVHKAMTPYDVFVHLSDKLDDFNTENQNITKQFFDRLGEVEGERRRDRAEIARMKEGRFPQRPLWAIAAAILICAVTFGGIASCNDLHPPPMVPASMYPLARR